VRVPVIIVEHLSDSQKRAYAIADNQIALHAEWNDELLRLELDALKGDGMDLALVGFSEGELQALADQLDSALRRVGEDSAREPEIFRGGEASSIWERT
jgi:ParB-like chromosome segregation protein Spo0J